MADQIPGPDGWSPWLLAAGSMLTGILGWRAWQPIGKWVGRRIDAASHARALERGDLVARLTEDLTAARAEIKAKVEENVELRQELGEERELRMTFAADYAATKAQIEMLSQKILEDKRDCQREIRGLKGEIRRLDTIIKSLHPPGREIPQ